MRLDTELLNQEIQFSQRQNFMGLSQIECFSVLAVCLSLLASLSASTSISGGIFGSSVLSGRRLLQAKKQCPQNFEFQNYTTITTQCKGPRYPPKLCCEAFKEFACQFADELNDLNNNCASTMFSYINLHGKYPPGLFANECKEGLSGLECPALPPHSSEVGRKKICACDKTHPRRIPAGWRRKRRGLACESKHGHLLLRGGSIYAALRYYCLGRRK